MQQNGEYRIAAPRERVWQALNDEVVLARCIEGCESLTRVANDALEAKVRARIGPVNALFAADIQLTEINAPVSYIMLGAVKGGAAGFAKGSAKVTLTEDGPSATVLRYEIEGSIGGKLAQVGQRLVDAAARKMADDFFACFSAEVGSAAAAPDASGPKRAPFGGLLGGQMIMWLVIAGLAAAALIGLTLARS